MTTTPLPEPIGHLDGTDMLADYMSAGIRQQHALTGSSTPKDYTVPVYTADQMHAHAAALTADLRAEIERLVEKNENLVLYNSQLAKKCDEIATLRAAAEQALEALEELADIVTNAIAQKSAKDLDSFTLQPAQITIATLTTALKGTV